MAYGLASAAVLLAVYAVVADPHGIITAMIIAMPFAAWFVLRRRLNAVYLSPTLIVVLFFAVIGIFGYVLRGFLASLNGRGTSIAIALTDDQAFQTLLLVMCASTLAIVTSGIALTALPRKVEALARSTEWSSPEPSSILVVLSGMPLVWIVASTGADLVSRTSYLFVGAGSLVGAIGGSLGTAMVVVVGYLFAASRRGKRALTVALLAGYTVVLFAMGSRKFALIPILFGLGLFLGKNSRRTRFAVFVCAALTAALLPLPLMFRASLLHGVGPYFQLFTQISPADADWAGALNNVLVSFGIVGDSAFGGQRVSAPDLWVSLNPLPGDTAGWYAISPRLRLNAYTPTAGLGELANVGLFPVVLFMLAVGLVLAWAEHRVRRHLVRGSHIFAAILIGLTALFAFQMVEYNLRSAVRMLVYMGGVEVAVYLIRMFVVRNREIDVQAKQAALVD